MKKTDKKGTRRPKKPYARPEVKQVELRAEEAVLGACKITGYTGPLSSDCHTPSNCYSQGS